MLWVKYTVYVQCVWGQSFLWQCQRPISRILWIPIRVNFIPFPLHSTGSTWLNFTLLTSIQFYLLLVACSLFSTGAGHDNDITWNYKQLSQKRWVASSWAEPVTRYLIWRRLGLLILCRNNVNQTGICYMKCSHYNCRLMLQSKLIIKV